MVLAWLGVLALFLLAEAVPALLRGRSVCTCSLSAAQALLLTLLGALWFASLGTGEWWLIFLLMGGLMELSAAAEAQAAEAARLARSGGVTHWASRGWSLAGGWLAWQLGPA